MLSRVFGQRKTAEMHSHCAFLVNGIFELIDLLAALNGGILNKKHPRERKINRQRR
jgi:hypothetical protein